MHSHAGCGVPANRAFETGRPIGSGRLACIRSGAPLNANVERKKPMRVIRQVLLTGVLLAGASKAETNSPSCYRHDFKQRDIPKLYLLSDSRGHNVTIKADDTLVWRGVVEKSDHMPNIHPVGIPPESRQKCRVRIVGGPYVAAMDIDWQKGKALIVHFADDRVILTQREEPVGFQ